jgi:hypothetical protein
LAALDEDTAQALRQQYTASQSDGKRIVVERTHQLCDANEKAHLRAELDSERTAIWLLLVGLLGITGIAAAFNHETTMLVGAVGGFLSPTVESLTSRDARSSSWGIMILSPVGGALTAIGGLLLVGLLSADGVGLLGEVFTNSWGNPNSVVALALALLFGFSGQLFSRPAISAASQLDRSTNTT